VVCSGTEILFVIFTGSVINCRHLSVLLCIDRYVKISELCSTYNKLKCIELTKS
jgi:hypothetical protein